MFVCLKQDTQIERNCGIFFNILYWIGSPLLNMQKWTLKRSWGCNVLSTWMQRPISPCSLSPRTACLIFHEADLFSAPSALGSSGLLIFPCSQFFCPCSQELVAHSSSLSSAKLVIYLQWCSHCNITLQSPLVVSPKNCTIIIQIFKGWLWIWRCNAGLGLADSQVASLGGCGFLPQ